MKKLLSGLLLSTALLAALPVSATEMTTTATTSSLTSETTTASTTATTTTTLLTETGSTTTVATETTANTIRTNQDLANLSLSLLMQADNKHFDVVVTAPANEGQTRLHIDLNTADVYGVSGDFKRLEPGVTRGTFNGNSVLDLHTDWDTTPDGIYEIYVEQRIHEVGPNFGNKIAEGRYYIKVVDNAIVGHSSDRGSLITPETTTSTVTETTTNPTTSSASTTSFRDTFVDDPRVVFTTEATTTSATSSTVAPRTTSIPQTTSLAKTSSEAKTSTAPKTTSKSSSEAVTTNPQTSKSTDKKSLPNTGESHNFLTVIGATLLAGLAYLGLSRKGKKN